ncbi:MAG: hypothetical protein F4X40_03525 [Chloroflexi bacterium]|nr:hypothetical protein [Chloroflexota bacterium]
MDYVFAVRRVQLGASDPVEAAHADIEKSASSSLHASIPLSEPANPLPDDDLIRAFESNHVMTIAGSRLGGRPEDAPLAEDDGHRLAAFFVGPKMNFSSMVHRPLADGAQRTPTPYETWDCSMIGLNRLGIFARILVVCSRYWFSAVPV